MADKKGHIIFDFDGTVVSNFEALKKLLSEPVSKPQTQSKLQSSKLGLKISSWIEYLGNITTLFHHHYEAYEGIPELLEELKDRGHELYIWTMRDKQSTEVILESVGLRHFFKIVKGTDSDHIKPGINGLLSMVGHHGPEKVVVVGDGWTDFIGAKVFGCPSIFAMWGKRYDAFLKKGGFSFSAEHPIECLDFIDHYFSENSLKKEA